MEDVQQRRQRLEAMREQAALEGDDATAPSSAIINPLGLANPMDSPATTAQELVKPSGFDFYTDPLTAFTGAKRRRPIHFGVSSQGPLITSAPQWRIASGPPPPHHFQPSPLMFIPPPHHPPPSASGWQPIPYQPPQLHAAPPPMNHHPHFSNQSLGRGMDSGFGGRAASNSPAGRGRSSGSSSPAGSYPRSPGQGRGHVTNDSWSGSAPVSWGNVNRGGFGRGHGRGDRASSARDQPQLYYKKSMMEDPWKQLEARMDKI